MHLTTKISFNGSSNGDVVLDKFFQFIVLNNQESNKCEVTIYNAIAFHNKSSTCKLIVEFLDEKRRRIKGIEHDDKSDFYKETDVLSQFWGANSRYDANIDEIIQAFNKENKVDHSDLYDHISSTKTDGVLGIEENKAEIKNIIIIPFKIKNEGDQLILKQDFCHKATEINSIISYGYWFKSKFNIEINTDQNGFSFISNIDFPDNVILKSPDFKTYIQTKKKYEIRRSSVDVKNSDDSKSGEIIKVFSQSKIKYFDEWANLGIYNSSLFKVNHGTAGGKVISEGGVKSISVKADMEDLEKPRRREINLLIFSIIFSLFTSFGFDRTRQTELSGFSDIFPDCSFLSIDALWLFVCLGVLLKFMFIKIAKVPKTFKVVLLLPVALWFSSYLTIYQTEWMKEILGKPEEIPVGLIYHILYYCNAVVMIYMAISIMLIIVLRPKKAPDAKKGWNNIHQIFGV